MRKVKLPPQAPKSLPSPIHGTRCDLMNLRTNMQQLASSFLTMLRTKPGAPHPYANNITL